MKQRAYGTLPDGRDIEEFTLTNVNGLSAKVITYGALLTELRVPDRTGQTADIVLGRDDLEGYQENNGFFGATVGRYANRIDRGHFILDGKTYTLARRGEHHLHGGDVGFDRRVWDTKAVELAAHEEAVELAYFSPDGEEGFPGNLSVRVLYALNDENELVMEYAAETDAPTPLSMTNHSYFNLAGEGDIRGHHLKLHADYYLPVKAGLIPTGEIWSVEGTPLDFREPMAIGDAFKRFAASPSYDHHYVLRNDHHTPSVCAELTDPASGRRMVMETNAPGVQFYSGSYMKDQAGKNGARHQACAALCLEPSHFPDSPNQPHFPNCILRPDEIYRQTIVCRFNTV